VYRHRQPRNPDNSQATQYLNHMAELSIVIVNWNTRELLRNCLHSMQRYLKESTVRIIVVDNASYDESREMVEVCFPEVKLINSGGNIGFAKANNIARPLANSPFVLFLNPDTVVIDDAIEKMRSFIETNPTVGAVSCKTKYSPEKGEALGADEGVHALGLQWYATPLTELVSILFLTDQTIQRLKRYLPYKDPNTSGYVLKLYGTCLMVRTEVLDRVGWFDERFFMYGEDVDLSRRISDAGWKLYYLSEAEILHLAGAASKNNSNQFPTLMTCESIAKLMRKYYGSLGQLLYRIIIFIGSGVRLTILGVARTASLSAGLNVKNYERPISKYAAMLKWSLGLQKAIIP
jgi:GT2 family glycosyltransferase